MATKRFRFVGAAGDARLEKRADGSGLIRQAQGTTRVRQNAAAIFVRAIGWIDRIATTCQRGAGAQARRETARPGSTGSVGRQRSAYAFFPCIGWKRITDRPCVGK